MIQNKTRDNRLVGRLKFCYFPKAESGSQYKFFHSIQPRAIYSTSAVRKVRGLVALRHSHAKL